MENHHQPTNSLSKSIIGVEDDCGLSTYLYVAEGNILEVDRDENAGVVKTYGVCEIVLDMDIEVNI